MYRENVLMETAMVIMIIFGNLCMDGDIDFDPFYIESNDRCADLLERLQYFCTLAREFEDTFAGTEQYNNNFMQLLDTWATEKLIEKYGE